MAGLVFTAVFYPLFHHAPIRPPMYATTPKMQSQDDASISRAVHATTPAQIISTPTNCMTLYGLDVCSTVSTLRGGTPLGDGVATPGAGLPHFGQAKALSLILFPHSAQSINAISPPLLFE
jgi:hypothetical protein